MSLNFLREQREGGLSKIEDSPLGKKVDISKTANYESNVSLARIENVNTKFDEDGTRKLTNLEKLVFQNKYGYSTKNLEENFRIGSDGTLIERKNEITELNSPIQNKIDGLARENEVSEELKTDYPSKKGFEIISEAYLRDSDGKIVRDLETNEGRRIDFIVAKDGVVIDSIEVTSKTADKTMQLAKEARIRDLGGNFIRDNSGNLIEIPSDLNTRIERRE